MESLTATGNFAVQGETDVKSLTATGNLTVQGDTEVNSLTATGNFTVQGETEVKSLTATGNLTVQGDTEVDSLTATGNLTAFQPISLVDPSEPYKFSLEYSSFNLVRSMVFTSTDSGGLSQEYIRLSDTIPGLIQLKTLTEVEDTLTAKQGVYSLASGGGLYVGEGSLATQKNAGLEYDTVSETGSLVIKPGGGTITALEFNASLLTARKPFTTAENITQTAGETTLKSTIVDNLRINTIGALELYDGGTPSTNIDSKFASVQSGVPQAIVRSSKSATGTILQSWTTPGEG